MVDLRRLADSGIQQLDTFQPAALRVVQRYWPIEHSHFKEIEELLNKVQATPTELAGELMKTDNVTSSLQGLIQFLHGKRDESSARPQEKLSKRLLFCYPP
ncbi:AAA-ATPase, partial [Cucurbita argyrosperma subsp. argyrosperma]